MVVYFDKINGLSVWSALRYALRGWKVLYFDQTRLGRLQAAMCRTLLGGRASFAPVEYQIGDYRGLTFEATRIAQEFTRDWFQSANGQQIQRLLESLEQPDRAAAYVKKTAFLHARRLALRLMVVAHMPGSPDGERRLIVDASTMTHQFVEAYSPLAGESTQVSAGRPQMPRMALALSLMRYLIGLGLLMVRRGVTIAPVPERYLIAKPAMWPIGLRRSDDFLVDRETIAPSDLLIYYNTKNLKPRVRESVLAAARAGYRPVAWDRVRVSLKWLVRPATIATYLLQPLLQTMVTLLTGGKQPCQVASMMLRLRRDILGWDIFFEKYRVGCLLESGFHEGQAAATMSIHNYGGIAAMIQASDDSDRYNDDQSYLAHHVRYTWGQGVAALRRSDWCANEVVPVGYIWGHLHQQSLSERDEIRARYGVPAGGRLITLFDTSVSRDSPSSHAALERFYDAAEKVASSFENVKVVIKPKDERHAAPHFKAQADGNAPSRVLLTDAIHTDTNELIAASDIVVSMGISSITAESLICGVPAIAFDEAGREWELVLARPDALVVESAEDLCRAVGQFLSDGIDPETWRQVQERVKHNFGGADGLALSRIRSHILRACEINSLLETAEMQDVVSSPHEANSAGAWKER